MALLNNPDFPGAAKIESRVRAAAGTLGVTVLPRYAKGHGSLAVVVDSLGITIRSTVILRADRVIE